tara:strand:+ start:783 stop:893 length:111 start_codon:yes stop_codon:yes gene_type:complete
MMKKPALNGDINTSTIKELNLPGTLKSNTEKLAVYG